MFLIVPFVGLAAFTASLLLTIVLKVRLILLARAGATPSPRLAWWYRSAGQLTMVFFLLFLLTRVYYLL